MRLTQRADYSLRVLMYCAHAAGREAPVTVSEIAKSHSISRAHLTKVVMTLAELGLLKTTRGRGGGLKLLKAADQINIGEVLRQTEKDFTLLECFDSDLNTCRMDRGCRLKSLLQRALAKFLAELDGVTLADVVGDGESRLGMPIPVKVLPKAALRKV